MDIMTLQDLVTSKIQNVNLANGNQKTGKNEDGSEFDFTAAFQTYSLNANQNTDSVANTAQTDSSEDAQNAYQMSATGTDRMDRGISQTQVSKNGTDENELSRDDMDNLRDFEQDVVKEISESTGLDEDSVEEAMEVLGLTVADLLNPQNLANLVTELTGETDPSAVLLDENFTALMSDISDLARNLADTLNVNPEELNTVLDDFNMAASLEPENADQFEGILVNSEKPEIENTILPDTTENEIADSQIVSSQPVQTESIEVAEEENPAAVETTEVAEEGAVLVKEDKSNQESVKTVNLEDETSQTEEKTIEVVDKRTVSDAKEESSAREESDTESREDSQPNHENAISQPVVSNETPAAEQAQTPDFVQTYTSVDQLDILEQVTSNLKISLANSETTMEMQLNPENLGKVYLQVTAKEGNVTAQITTQNEVVKEALEAQLATLRENLNTQGVKVDAIEVTVSSHGFEKNLDDGQQREQEEGRQAEENNQRRSIRMDSLDELSGLMTEEEMLVAQIMHDNGNSMDLTA